MKIVSVSEDQKIERRIAITPEIAKKYIALGFEVSLPENYGEHLGFADDKYKELGSHGAKALLTFLFLIGLNRALYCSFIFSQRCSWI